MNLARLSVCVCVCVFVGVAAKCELYVSLRMPLRYNHFNAVFDVCRMSRQQLHLTFDASAGTVVARKVRLSLCLSVSLSLSLSLCLSLSLSLLLSLSLTHPVVVCHSACVPPFSSAAKRQPCQPILCGDGRRGPCGGCQRQRLPSGGRGALPACDLLLHTRPSVTLSCFVRMLCFCWRPIHAKS